MTVTLRRYKMLADFDRVSTLLRNNFVKYFKSGNLPQPYWEYAHVHPYFNYQLTHRFGIWEEDNDIVGVACYEMAPGDCYMFTKLGYEYLKPEMIEYAEKELYKIDKQRKILTVSVFDYEHQLIDILYQRGYKKVWAEPMKIFEYVKGFIDYQLPEGFSLISLEEENDIQQIHNALWRGFDHGDTPDNDLDCRLQMQSAPNFKKDLTIIAKAPDGEYACFCGMWVDGVNDFAYLEPLATVPKYRKHGLAKAALTESMQRTRKYGATYCIGGGNEFYSKIGFKTICYFEKWTKKW